LELTSVGDVFIVYLNQLAVVNENG